MTRLRTAVPVLLLLLAGCSSAEPSTAQAPADLPAGLETVLAGHDLVGLSGKEMVDHLDRLGGADRPGDLMASVRAAELVVSDGRAEAVVALPQDEFYVAFAPYVNQTHDCYFHSLTTCQGELVGADVDVRIVSDDGDVLVDEVTTTFDNGFVGYWLPRDIEGTLEVEYEGLTGVLDIATDADSPTCLTTLQLT